MTEKQFELVSNGQAVQKDDLNTIAQQAARTSDWLLWELLRVPSTSGSGIPFKAVIPGGGPASAGFSSMHRQPIVRSSASADAKVKVGIFTAVVGSIQNDAANPKEALRDVHTVTHYGAGTDPSFNSNTFQTEIQFPAATNFRWDLIWARVEVDVPDPTVSRFVKSGDGQATSQNVQLTKQTKITIGRTAGTESGSPVRPALPAESAGVYYFELAYVLLPPGHNLTTKIPGYVIHEVYRPLGLSASLGGQRFAPADGHYRTDGATFLNEGWSINKPASYLPPGMLGVEGRQIALGARDGGGGTNRNVPPNTTTLLDASIDWRKRNFKVTMLENSGSAPWPWMISPGGAYTPIFNPGTGKYPVTVMGQSFVADGGTFSISNAGVVAAMTDTNDYTQRVMVAAGAVIVVYVDLTDGGLKVWRNAVDANRNIFLWLEATGAYRNNDLDSV